MPPVTAPIIGMMTSPTSEFTMPENAAPMITPMARSTTLPRSANFLNSSSMAMSPPLRHGRAQPSKGRRAFARLVPATTRNRLLTAPRHPLIDQAGVHHRLAHSGLRLLARRHHRQPHGIGALADERHRILDRRRTRFDKQINV